MNASLMFNAHHATEPWSWQIAPSQATTLAADSVPRWLHVQAGSVWLTRANGAAQADDIWLQAGESLALPAGTEWVLEGWPQARLSLLLQAPVAAAARRPAAWQRSAWWRPAWVRRLAF